MKLRFGIDGAAYARLRAVLDAASAEPPVGRRITHVYLDTPDNELARRGVSLRFRRAAALGVASPGRRFRREWLWPKQGGPRSLKELGIPRLKQRIDATFTVRIERWTWTPRPWAAVSLDHVAIDAGSAREEASELRLVCRKRYREDATNYAVELGATRVISRSPRARGRALLGIEVP